MISIDTIKAAQDSDLSATAAILDEMSARLDGLAHHHASKLRNGGYQNNYEHLRVTADSVLWEFVTTDAALSGDFAARAYRNADMRLRDETRAMRGVPAGVTDDDMKAFNRAVERADGNLDLAVQIAMTVPYAGSGLMSWDRAYRARQARECALSLNTPARPGDSGTTLLDTLPAVEDAPSVDDTSRVGRRKIQAAFDYLSDYITVSGDASRIMEACDYLSRGLVSETSLDVISEHITLPRSRTERLCVQAAFGILAAAAKSVDHSATPSSEYDDRSEENPGARSMGAHIRAVRAVLDSMGEKQRIILEHVCGIGERRAYGSGERMSLDGGMSSELAEELGWTPKDVESTRTKALRAFAKRWIKATALGEHHATMLKVAEDKYLGRGGRK